MRIRYDICLPRLGSEIITGRMPFAMLACCGNSKLRCDKASRQPDSKAQRHADTLTV